MHTCACMHACARACVHACASACVLVCVVFANAMVHMPDINSVPMHVYAWLHGKYWLHLCILWKPVMCITISLRQKANGKTADTT